MLTDMEMTCAPVSSKEIDTDRFYLLRLFHVGSGTGIQSCELVIRSDGTHDFRIIKDIPTPTKLLVVLI